MVRIVVDPGHTGFASHHPVPDSTDSERMQQETESKIAARKGDWNFTLDDNDQRIVIRIGHVNALRSDCRWS